MPEPEGPPTAAAGLSGAELEPLAGSAAVSATEPASRHSEDLKRELVKRVGERHAQARLSIESKDNVRRGLGGQTWMHVESWPGGDHLIRTAFRLSGLYRRAKSNARKIEVVRRDLWLPRLPEALAGLRVLHLSDLHLDMAEDIPKAIAAAVRGLRYDICVLTGDYRARTYGTCDEAMAGLALLMDNLTGPVFGVLGNHDSITMVPEMERLGVRMLINEHTIFERAEATLYIAGVDDPHYFGTHDLQAARAGMPEDAVSLLLGHSPELYQEAADANFDALLCGHTHGGQICLPGGIAVVSNAPAPRRVCVGGWQQGEMRGYTSRGCGVSVVDLRLNCPPEVTLHTLTGPVETDI